MAYGEKPGKFFIDVSYSNGANANYTLEVDNPSLVDKCQIRINFPASPGIPDWSGSCINGVFR
jgi:hypothetical protein